MTECSQDDGCLLAGGGEQNLRVPAIFSLVVVANPERSPSKCWKREKELYSRNSCGAILPSLLKHLPLLCC